MKITIASNRVSCRKPEKESLPGCECENLRCAFRTILRMVSASGLLSALIFLTGCLSDKSLFNTPATPAPAVGTQTDTVTLTNELDPHLLEVPTRMFTLGPGDRVELELIGDPASRTTTVVAPDGKLYFNLLPGADVWGLTLMEAKAQLENSFTNYVREQPHVAITLRSVDSKHVWILGCVQAPGIYAMATPMTLLESVSAAGGTLSMTTFRDQSAAGIGEELADLKRSFVLRHGKLLPVDFSRLFYEGDFSQNIYLEPDDFIYVPAAAARDVFVLGAVTQPRPVPYMEGMTVASAVAGAYGTLPDAYVSQVAVVRGSLSKPQLTIVNYRKVIRGEAPDFLLKPHDIVYVPFSPYRFLKRYVEVILNTFVTASAINAGAYAVPAQQGVVGGVFIPVGSGIQIIPPINPTPP
jgi:protein involved in polysaccharide export with SLBB domain